MGSSNNCEIMAALLDFSRVKEVYFCDGEYKKSTLPVSKKNVLKQKKLCHYSAINPNNNAVILPGI